MPSTTSTSTFPPPLLPYRDTNNHTIRYLPTTTTTPTTTPINPFLSEYDSDFEPLISSTPPSELDEHDLLHFTATGRPMPLVNDAASVRLFKGMSGDMYSLPHLLPKRYTDESIIPAIIVDYTPRSDTDTTLASTSNSTSTSTSTPNHTTSPAPKPRKSLIRKLTGSNGSHGKHKGLLKVVYMPRGEYLRYFARGLKGEYVGTEPFRRWREEEIDERYGRFKPVVPVGRRGRRTG